MLVPSGYGYPIKLYTKGVIGIGMICPMPPDTVLKNASNWSGVPLSSKSSSASNAPRSEAKLSKASIFNKNSQDYPILPHEIKKESFQKNT